MKLTVYYDALATAEITDKDQEAIEIAGQAPCGSGYHFGMAVRDLEFSFQSDEKYESAKAQLKEAGFRFFP